MGKSYCTFHIINFLLTEATIALQWLSTELLSLVLLLQMVSHCSPCIYPYEFNHTKSGTVIWGRINEHIVHE